MPRSSTEMPARPRPSRRLRNPRFPTLGIGLSLGLTLLALLLLGKETRDAYQLAGQARAEALQLEQLGSDVLRLDEVLTMSAHMAAAGGAAVWQQRYWREASKLDAVLSRCLEHADSSATLAQVRAVQDANRQMMELERRALSLVNAGQRADAAAVLNGAAYASLKQAYAERAGRMMEQLRGRVDDSLEKRRNRLRALVYVSLGGLLLGFALWLVVLRRISAWHDSLRRSTARLRRAELRNRRLAAIVRSADDAIIAKRLDGTIISWNQAAERIYGYSEAEALGRPVSMLSPQGCLDETAGLLERLARGEAIDHYRTVRRRKDGTAVDVSLCLSPIRDRAGRVVAAAAVARDITRETRSEQERERLLTELQQALSQIRTIRGLLPICANCKKIRDDQGYWKQVETYISDHSDVRFSHGICPECLRALYPDMTL